MVTMTYARFCHLSPLSPLFFGMGAKDKALFAAQTPPKASNLKSGRAENGLRRSVQARQIAGFCCLWVTGGQAGRWVARGGQCLPMSYPRNWEVSTPCAGGIGLLGLIPPLFNFLPPEVPPRYPGTWHTLPDVNERQKLGFHRGKEKSRTSLGLCGFICGARGRTRSQAANPHET